MDAAVVDVRQQRGLALAKASRIKQVVANTYLVPSASAQGAKYVVDVSAGTCTCPDHELRGTVFKCKHRWAVAYARHEVTAPDGTTEVVETMRVTYGQPWAQYNAEQCEEKDRVQVLLRGLCEGIQNPVQKGRGNRIIMPSDVIYAATMKTYVNMSGRRATSDVRACEEKGYVGKAPKYNTIFEHMGTPTMTPLLQKLVEESAAPLAAVDGLETTFAADGTGFSTSVYHRYFDHKYGKEKKEATWMKLHAMCGVRTNVVTAAIVTEGYKSDSPELPKLVATTDKRFIVNEVLADKGYIGLENLEAVDAVGAIPYIPFHVNHKGDGADLWRKMWHYYSFHRREFLERYHQRSNIECTFSAIKRKFGGAVRAKNFDARVNEVLLKVLCHNLSCLVHSIHELGIAPEFWGSPLKQVGT